MPGLKPRHPEALIMKRGTMRIEDTNEFTFKNNQKDAETELGKTGMFGCLGTNISKVQN